MNLNKTIFITIFASVLFFNCKNDTTTSTKQNEDATGVSNTANPSQPQADTSAILNTGELKKSTGPTGNAPNQPAYEASNPTFKGSDLPIPDPCNLISESWFKANAGFKVNNLTIKSGNRGKVVNDRSCFFKFDYPGVANAGIMVQVMTNPLVEEAPNYHVTAIESLITNGENSMFTGKPVKFKALTGLGDAGAYSYEGQKYQWRVKNDYSIKLAMNLDLSEAKQKELALKVGKEIMRNFSPGK